MDSHVDMFGRLLNLLEGYKLKRTFQGLKRYFLKDECVFFNQ